MNEKGICILSASNLLVKDRQATVGAKLLQPTELQGPDVRVGVLTTRKYESLTPVTWLKRSG